MPSPFAAGGQTDRIPELAVGQNNFEPEIHIFTREDNGQITYPQQVRLDPNSRSYKTGILEAGMIYY